MRMDASTKRKQALNASTQHKHPTQAQNATSQRKH